jgi:diaminopimelate decarboxylase
MLALVQVRFFVLDEADRLIDHLEEVMTLFKRLPKAGVGIDRLQVGGGKRVGYPPHRYIKSTSTPCWPRQR